MSKFILARYILREHIGPFFFAFFVITLLFLLNLLFRELSRILSKGLPWHIVIEFFALNMAWIIALAVPMAVLTATLMAFGRLSADNEITAMEAGGVSIYAILAPALVASIMIDISLVWFNNNVLPDFNHRTRVLASDIGRKRPTLNIEPGVWYDDIPNFGLLVQELEDTVGVTKARNLLINDYSGKDQSRTISAKHGVIQLSEIQGALVLTLFEGEVQEIDIKKPEEFRRVAFPKHLISIPVNDMFLKRSESDYRGDREKSASDMRADIAKNEIDIRKRSANIKKAIAIHADENVKNKLPIDISAIIQLELPDDSSTTSNAETLARPSTNGRPSPHYKNRASQLTDLTNQHRVLLNQINREVAVIHSYTRKNKSLMVEIQKKYSIPFACIVFVMIGGPLGIMARRGGIATGGGVSLIFFLLYWTFLVGGEDLADRQIISPYSAMWSANLVVGVAGIFLVLRAAREHSTVNLASIIERFQKSKHKGSALQVGSSKI